jgi:hypothetical protein
VIRLGCRPAPHPAHVLLAAQVADAVPQVEQRPHLLGLHLLQQGSEAPRPGIPGEDPLLYRIIEVGTVAADDGVSRASSWWKGRAVMKWRPVTSSTLMPWARAWAGPPG